jgi:hypothetical protein
MIRLRHGRGIYECWVVLLPRVCSGSDAAAERGSFAGMPCRCVSAAAADSASLAPPLFRSTTGLCFLLRSPLQPESHASVPFARTASLLRFPPRALAPRSTTGLCYVFGSAGSGKSSLLRALAARRADDGPAGGGGGAGGGGAGGLPARSAGSPPLTAVGSLACEDGRARTLALVEVRRRPD